MSDFVAETVGYALMPNYSETTRYGAAHVSKHSRLAWTVADERIVRRGRPGTW